jgi:hypothetical protein
MLHLLFANVERQEISLKNKEMTRMISEHKTLFNILDFFCLVYFRNYLCK